MRYQRRLLVVFLLLAGALATSCSKKPEIQPGMRLPPGYKEPASSKKPVAGKKEKIITGLQPKGAQLSQP